jgi:TM2 domain-containing membrane protein YozV
MPPHRIWHAESMTDPQPGPRPGDGDMPSGSNEYPPLPPYNTGTPPPQYGPPGGFGGYGTGHPPPPPGYSQPYADPSAPYGRHPVTGEPYSDKSKVVAGLLQLLGLFGFLGIGRMYIGQVGLGVAQLLIGWIGGFVLGIITCGLGFALPAIWGIIDAVLILTGRVRDAQGRPLRDGT